MSTMASLQYTKRSELGGEGARERENCAFAGESAKQNREIDFRLRDREKAQGQRLLCQQKDLNFGDDARTDVRTVARIIQHVERYVPVSILHLHVRERGIE